jgi:hypothetical protein
MRYAKVPAAIRLISRTFDLTTGKVITSDGELLSFEAFANTFWLNSNKWETPKANLAKLVRVVNEVRKAPLEWMAFEGDDWDILCGIIRNPDTSPGSPRPNAPPPLAAIQLTAFDDAILNATDAKPEGV